MQATLLGGFFFDRELTCLPKAAVCDSKLMVESFLTRYVKLRGMSDSVKVIVNTYQSLIIVQERSFLFKVQINESTGMLTGRLLQQLFKQEKIF